ncbi:Putative odorant receptor 92a [Harpegnathos saltator]|uniref:Odorant receptor n=1 Tax=Harpegnathos saltator TaxID=610380 RepID=E2BZM1_HARSA|nr:Putative odorant receptor 92a [Harpegnathos saltator]
MALSTAQVFQYGYVVVNSDTDNFSEFMDGVSSAMASSLLFIKLIILWINQRLGVLAANAGDPEKWEPYNRELILKMKLPFEISTYRIYVTITVVQFVHLMFVGWGITVVNTLLVTLVRSSCVRTDVSDRICTNREGFDFFVMSLCDHEIQSVSPKHTRVPLKVDSLRQILHIGGQIDILRDWLTRAFSRNESEPSDKITSRLLITKHQQIILLSENIENLYTYIAFMILFSDTLIICCLGFVIATSVGEPNAAAILVKSFMFYVTMNLDVFIYCYAGEYLSAKSKMIGDAAYDSLWYNVAAKDSQIVLFIILRSQKRLTITCGKIMDLSLERFTSVRFVRKD